MSSTLMSGHPAVFLDRDGVLTVPEFRDGRSFAPRRLEDFRLYDDAAECLKKLKSAGFMLVVVTNQPDVGHGLVAREVVEEMHRQLRGILPVDMIQTCYHRAEDRCGCRKPGAGMLLMAAKELGIDCGRSVMVGDRGSDVDAGRSAGCTTVFIDLDYLDEPSSSPDHTARSLVEATDLILNRYHPGMHKP